MKTSELKLNDKNPRKISKDKLEKLKQSIKDFEIMMAARPIVIDSNNIILGGNMRFTALKALGYKEIPDNWVYKMDDLTDEQKKEFIIKDNVGFGEWDWDILKFEFDEADLVNWGLEFPVDMIEETILEAEEDDYEEPENIEVDVVLGDLIEFECTDGRVHRLICGDSTDSDTVERLMNKEKADMVFTDPPYGVDYNGQISSMTYNGIKGKPRDIILNDKDTKSIIDFMPLLKMFCNGVAYVFCGAGKELDLLQSIKDNNYEFINTLIWNKPKGTLALGANYKPCFELFYYIKIQGDRKWSGNNAEWTVWDIEYKKDNTLHPTQKPIGLIEKAIKNHNTKSVLDFFLGSGSTMVAAHQLKRKCYGMELDPKYCQVIIDRMQKLDSSIKVKINGTEYEQTKSNA